MSASKIQNLTGNLGTRWCGEKSKCSLFMSVCLDLVWTAINGGNISLGRAHEKILGFEKEQQGLQTQYGLRSQQNFSGSETHPTLCINLSEPARIIFLQVCLLQLTVI